AIYRAGKVRYLLVSGDNHVAGYDEPSDMADALVAAGVPRSRIVLDYAGFSTLDSVVRAKAVFGQEKITIISQEFHNKRALFIARAHGIDAVACNARQPELVYGIRTMLREQLALVKTLADITILSRKPHFYGPPVFIGQADAAPAQAPQG
ncbi:MAG TPA: ElyC/SanA/YdcF family protein, partial [Opitutales bacterium]|nr:ElyC/SanA/YdcF family protein [Opitutales bacterium]